MKRTTLIVAVVLGGLLIVGSWFLHRSTDTEVKSVPDEIPRPATRTDALDQAPRMPVEESPVKAVHAELATGAADVKVIMDAAGNPAKTVRTDSAGRIISETEYKDGQIFTTERVYGEDGSLLREKKLLNGRPLREAD